MLPPGAVDAHAQVFVRPAGPAPTARYEPNPGAPVERYLDLLDAQGLAAGVLIQPGFLGTDNSYLLAAIRRVPARFRGVAVVPRGDPDLLDRLKSAGIAGIRLDLTGAGQRPPDFAAPPWRDYLGQVARRSLHVEVEAEGPVWVDILKPLLASGARVVVTHFGRPSAGLGARCPGFQTLAAAARDADIWFKLSAPYRFTPPTAAWTCADVLMAIVGVGRLVWGSDWPWTQHPEIARYGDTLSWLAEWVPNAAARAQILGANARTLYGFNRPLGVAAPPWKRL